MGQWTNVPTTGIENTCNVARVFSDENELYAYVANGGLYKSTDNGETWSPFNAGLPAGVEIRGLVANGTKVYVAANKNGIYTSEKATASFTKLGTVSKVDKDFTALVGIKDTLYLGTNGNGVFKCVIPTVVFSQINSSLNTSVTSLAVDTITGVSKRLYAATNSDNGFYVKNVNNDTWVQKIINNESNKPRLNSIFAIGGKVMLGGTALARGLMFIGTTTDFNTYSFAKADTSMVTANVNAIASDGQYIYFAGSGGLFKSTNLASPIIRYTQLSSGLQSPRGSTSSLRLLPNGQLWVSQQTGAYKSSDGGTTWTRKLNEKLSVPTINGFKENEGKLYALTGSGIYESASGNGGDWVKFGNGINSNVGLKGLSFGPLGTFATTDAALFKLNGTNWESVTIDLPGYAWDHPRGGQIGDIEQFNNGTKTCLFGSNWRSAGIYRFDGITWDLYSTTTINDVTDAVTGDADTGLTLSTAGDSTQSVIALKFMYDATTNTLFSFGKNTIQYSKDFGDSWQWKMQNYEIRLNQGNFRAVAMKNNGAQKFIYIGTDNTYAGSWQIGKTEFGTTPENVGGNWTNLTASVGTLETSDILVWDNSPLMIMRNTTAAVKVSTDDGLTGKFFETGITTKANIRSLSKVGFYAYIGTSTNEIQRYNVAAVPVFVSDAPAVTTIATTTAKLEATSSIPGTIYTVVVIKNATSPSALQIVAGKDATDAAALSPANATAIANTKTTIDISGLSENTDYTLYTVAVSETGVASTVTSIDFKTTISAGLDIPKMVTAIYPVPAKGLLNVTMAVDARVCITNLLGAQLIATQGKAGETLKIDVSNLKAGVYLVETNNGINKRIEKITIR